MAEHKKKVCVIFGGQSSEHEISRVSATSVINNLDKEKYKIIMLGITKKGKWYLYSGKVENLHNGAWEKDRKHLKPAVLSPSSRDKGLLIEGADGKLRRMRVDVIFPVLHGMYGEDGTVQGLFELSGLPYVGCGVLASSVGMNKIYMKYVFEKAGLTQAKWLPFYTKDFAHIDEMAEQIEKELGYPCFIKPANAGSSVGITRAENRQEVLDGLRLAAENDRQIVVEEAVVGREVECSVLGNASKNGSVRASAVGEIVSAAGFYDYEEKYKTDTAELVIPAKLDAAVSGRIRECARTAFCAIDGAGLSRVDFFVRQRDGAVVINEINTLPGFTSISMYAALWNVSGLPYGALLDELIALAYTRQK